MNWITDKLPDSDSPVLIRCSGTELPVWPGFHNGEEWRSAENASTIEGPVLGWMELEDAARLLDANSKPRQGMQEIPFKQWRVEEGQRLKISEHAVFNRVQRGHYPDLELRRVNKRVVFVVL